MNSNNTLHFYNTSGSGTSTCLLNAILPEKVQNARVENNNPNSLRQIIQQQLKEIINKYNSSIPSEKQKAIQIIELLINDIFDQGTLDKCKNQSGIMDSNKIKNLKNVANANDKDKFLSENTDNLVVIYDKLHGEANEQLTESELATFVSLFDDKKIFNKTILSISDNQPISQNLIPILAEYAKKTIVLVTPKTNTSTGKNDIGNYNYNINIHDNNKQFNIDDCTFVHHDGNSGNHYSHLGITESQAFTNARYISTDITDFNQESFKKLYEAKQLSDALDHIIVDKRNNIFSFQDKASNDSIEFNGLHIKSGEMGSVTKDGNIISLTKDTLTYKIIHHNNQYLILEKKQGAEDCYEVLHPVSDKYKEFVWINNHHQVQGRVKIIYQTWGVEKIGAETGITVDATTKAITYNGNQVQFSTLLPLLPNGINLKNEIKGFTSGNNDGEILTVINGTPVILQYSDTSITGSNHPEYKINIDGQEKTIYINRWKLANPASAIGTSKIGKSADAKMDDWHDLNNTGKGNGFVLEFNKIFNLIEKGKKVEQPAPQPILQPIPAALITAFTNAGFTNTSTYITVSTGCTRDMIPFNGTNYTIANHTAEKIGTSNKYIVTQTVSNPSVQYVFDGTNTTAPTVYKVTQDLSQYGGGYIVRTSNQNATSETYARIDATGAQTVLTVNYPIEIAIDATHKAYLMKDQDGKAIILTKAANNTWTPDIAALGANASQSGNVISIKNPTTNAFTYFDVDTTSGALTSNINSLPDVNNAAITANSGFNTVLPEGVNLNPTISQNKTGTDAHNHEITINNKKACFNAGAGVKNVDTANANQITYTKTVNGVAYNVSINTTTANQCKKTVTWCDAPNDCVLTQTINTGVTPNTSTETLTINGQNATYTATANGQAAYWTANGVNYSIVNGVFTAPKPVPPNSDIELTNLAFNSYIGKLDALKNDIQTLKDGTKLNTKSNTGYKKIDNQVEYITAKTDKEGKLTTNIDKHSTEIIPTSVINISNIRDTIQAFFHQYHDNGALKTDMANNVNIVNKEELEIIDKEKFLASCLKYLNQDKIWQNMMIADRNMTPLDYLLNYVFREKSNEFDNNKSDGRGDKEIDNPFYKYLSKMPENEKFAFNNIAIYQLRGGKNDEYLKINHSNNDLNNVLAKCNELINTYPNNAKTNKPSNLEVMSILADLAWTTSPIHGDIPNTLDPLAFIAQDNFRMLDIWKTKLNPQDYQSVCDLVYWCTAKLKIDQGEKIDYNLWSKFIKKIPDEIHNDRVTRLVFDGNNPKTSNAMIRNAENKPATIPYAKMEGYFKALEKKGIDPRSSYGSDFNWKDPNDVANLYVKGTIVSNNKNDTNAAKFASWCKNNSTLQGFVFNKDDDLNIMKRRINSYYRSMSDVHVANDALPFPTDKSGNFTNPTTRTCSITFGTGSSDVTKQIDLARYFDTTGDNANIFKDGANFAALQKDITDAVIGEQANQARNNRGGCR
jgi:hypothetical protein